MSTNINITVGGNSLIDQAKAQQQAARTAKLLKDNQTRVEAEAKTKRDAELARQGLAPNGQPVNGTVPAPQFRPDEPAANRDFGTLIGHVWDETTSQEVRTDPPYVILGGLKTNSVGTTGSSVRFSTSYRLRSGRGIANALAGNSDENLATSGPSENYTWVPAGFGWYYLDSNDGYYAYAYGPRKMEVDKTASGGIGTLILPAGKDKFVIIRSTVEFYWSIHLTCTHFESIFAEFGPRPGDMVSGQPYPDPYERLGSPETYFAGSQVLAPGGQVKIGYQIICPDDWPTVSSCQPAHQIIEPIIEEYASPYTVNHYVFLCSNNSIEQIEISPTLQNFLDWIVPGTAQYQVKSVPNVPQPNDPWFDTVKYNVPSYPNKIGIINTINENSNIGFDSAGATGYVTRITPYVYETLNAQYPFTSASNLKNPNSIKHRVSPDTRTGSYSQVNFTGDRYLQNLPLCYAKNLRTAPFNQLGKKEFCLNLSTSRPMDQIDRGQVAVWDWDDPAYCRARLNDLGISI